MTCSPTWRSSRTVSICAMPDAAIQFGFCLEMCQIKLLCKLATVSLQTLVSKTISLVRLHGILSFSFMAVSAISLSKHCLKSWFYHAVFGSPHENSWSNSRRCPNPSATEHKGHHNLPPNHLQHARQTSAFSFPWMQWRYNQQISTLVVASQTNR